MVVVYLILLAVYILLFFLSAKERLPPEEGVSAVERPFRKIACYLLRRLNERNRKKGAGKSNWKRETYRRQLGGKLETLQPTGNAVNQVERFLVSRYSLVLISVFCGNMVCLCVWAGAHAGTLLTEGKFIQRNEYGQGEIPVILSAQIEGEEDAEVIDYVVEERIYTEKELALLYGEIQDCLPEIIRGDNKSLEDVRADLNLVTSVKGYPFRIAWESSSYARIDTDGKVDNQELEKEEVVMLTAHIRYEEWSRDYQFYVQVNPAVYTGKELLRKNLEEAVRTLGEETQNDPKMELPAQVGTRQVAWRQVTEDSSGYFMVLVIAASVLLYWGKNRDLDQKLEQRRRQLLLDYPEIVNKLALYMGAGMTIRNAFLKMGEDYKRQSKKEKRYAYEEILLTCYELQSGKSEVEAYDHFGKRCQVQSYIKLSTLLSQNIRKGSNDLLSMLRREAQDAFAERKNLAKKLGEEAGTKLLLPMMMMLCVVMVIIMIPAYFSFLS